MESRLDIVFISELKWLSLDRVEPAQKFKTMMLFRNKYSKSVCCFLNSLFVVSAKENTSYVDFFQQKFISLTISRESKIDFL